MADDGMTPTSGAESSVRAVAAEHPALQVHPALVGPTPAQGVNTIRTSIIPVACWRLDDIRFRFDSSFLLPEIASEMKLLARLIQAHPGAPASVFGHADPVGDEEYNKKLSGRRAAAIYALLTRNVDIWEDIYSQTGKYAAALSNDDWGLRSVQTMLQALGYDPGPVDGQMDRRTREAVRSFQSNQSEHGLAVDGDPGEKTRKRLFAEYMDAICRDGNVSPFRMQAADFLGGGADVRGKADYQGCSEFNPVLLFSREENERLSRAEHREERNRENARNRRVMVLLFRPGSRVSLDRWPCPRAKEGAEGCRRRLFSDAETRRTLGDSRRVFDETPNTFACRFYQRISSNSPCERISPPPVPAISFVEFLFRDGAGYPVEVLCRLTDSAGDSGPFEIAAAGRVFRDGIPAGTCHIEALDIREVGWRPETVEPGEPVEVVAETDPPVEGIALSIAIYREGRERSGEAVAQAEATTAGPAGQARFGWRYEPERSERKDARFVARAQVGATWKKSPAVTLPLPTLANALWGGDGDPGLRLTVEGRGIKPGTEVCFAVYRMNSLGADTKIADLPPVPACDGLIETTWRGDVTRTDADAGQKQAYVYFVAEVSGESLRSDHRLVPLPPEPHPQVRRTAKLIPVEEQAPFEWIDPEEDLFS